MEQYITKHIPNIQSISKLDKTKFSELYIITDKDGHQFVIKVFPASSSPDSGEPYLLSKLKHPHIIQIIEYWEDNLCYYLRLPYATQSDLFEYLDKQHYPFNEPQSRIIFKQIVDAVAHAHGQKICHRDIKLDNIFVYNSNHFVLADWAFARDFSSGKLVQECYGSYDYLSPELVNDQHYLGPKVDIWALGIVLYALLTQQLPFTDYKKYKVVYIQAVTKASYYMPQHFTMKVKDLLMGLLCPDYKMRLTVTDVQNHPWMII